MLSLIIKEGPSAGATFPLERTNLVIGREPGVDVLIELPGISRRHARLFQQNNGYAIEDLGSSNGTFVNGERLAAPRQLFSGDFDPPGTVRRPRIPRRPGAGLSHPVGRTQAKAERYLYGRRRAAVWADNRRSGAAALTDGLPTPIDHRHRRRNPAHLYVDLISNLDRPQRR